jgi:hypothetical protein
MSGSTVVYGYGFPTYNLEIPKVKKKFKFRQNVFVGAWEIWCSAVREKSNIGESFISWDEKWRSDMIEFFPLVEWLEMGKDFSNGNEIATDGDLQGKSSNKDILFPKFPKRIDHFELALVPFW